VMEVSNGSRGANVTGLDPGMVYVVRVFYSSEGGVYVSEWSEEEAFRTCDVLVCSACEAASPTSLVVQWETSLTRHHVNQLLSISMTTTQGEQLEMATVLANKPNGSYVVTGLHPWTHYLFTVAVGNSGSHTHLVSECPTQSCMTLEDVPSQPPLNFVMSASTAHSVTLEWDPPPPGSQNGILTHYLLTFACTVPTDWRDCNHSTTTVIPAEGDGSRIVNTVRGLIPYTEYRFQVAAETHSGKGPAVSLPGNTTHDGQ
jgi:hypothetical protein